MDTRKKRSLLVEKLSRLHSSMASFNRSDDSYDQCLKRLTVFSENSDADSVKVLYRILQALPNIEKGTKRETYFSFLENFNSELIELGYSTNDLDEDLTSNEQEVVDLFVDENIGKNLTIKRFITKTLSPKVRSVKYHCNLPTRTPHVISILPL